MHDDEWAKNRFRVAQNEDGSLDLEMEFIFSNGETQVRRTKLTPRQAAQLGLPLLEGVDEIAFFEYLEKLYNNGK
ncbi:MAG: hypothetical protein ABIL07_08000 [candidate division WOR-3 bacterium]